MIATSILCISGNLTILIWGVFFEILLNKKRDVLCINGLPYDVPPGLLFYDLSFYTHCRDRELWTFLLKMKQHNHKFW